MNSGIVKPVIKLLTVGLILAAAKFIYLFFDVYNILDFVVFLFAGIAFGGKVPPNRLALGLALALPAFVLSLLFVIKLGYASIAKGIGTSYAVSLIVIPLATAIGLFIHSKRALRKKRREK